MNNNYFIAAFIGLLAIALFGMLLLGIYAGRAPEARNCQDFTSHEEAQTAFDADTKKYDKLDGDGDGEACEDLPAKEPSSVERIIEKVIPKAEAPTTQPQVLQLEGEAKVIIEASPNPTESPRTSETPEPTQSSTPAPNPTPQPTPTPIVCVGNLCLGGELL